MQIIRQMICDEALDLRNFASMYGTMMTHLKETGQKTKSKFNKCLLDSFVKLYSSMFCVAEKEKNYQSVLYYGMYIAKCTKEKNVNHTTCEFFKAMIKDQTFIQSIMGYFCTAVQEREVSQHHVSKRQYSLKSMIFLFKHISCDISETLQEILVIAQERFSYLNKNNPFREYVDWNLVNEILPEFLCCFADAMDTHTRKHVPSVSNAESFAVSVSAFLAVLFTGFLHFI